MSRLKWVLLLTLPMVFPSSRELLGQQLMGPVTVGFGGYFKVGMWAPLDVTIRGPAQGRLRMRLPDGDGGPTLLDLGDSQLQLREGQEKRISTVFRVGRMVRSLQLEWVDGDSVISRTVPLDADKVLFSTDELQLRLGADLELRNALQTARGVEARRVTVVGIEDYRTLPSQWLAYDAVDLIVMTTGIAESLKSLESLTDDQFKTLDGWLLSGGRMLWSVGANGERLFAEGSRFARLAPGKFLRTATRWRTAALETYAAATDPLQGAVAGTISAPLSVFDAPQQAFLWDGQAGARNLPILFRHAYGLGQILLVAVDLDQPPVRDWGNRRNLLAKLLKQLALEDLAMRKERKQLVHVGFRDLSGQLRSALDQFEGVSLVSFSWIIVVLVAYILLIGPADYFLLRKLGRPHWSWITFPTLVLAFVMGTLVLTQRWRSTDSRINQVELVDIDISTRYVRGTAWAHLYSSSARTYDLTMDFRAAKISPQDPALITWQGLPGNGLGGFESKNASASQRVYTIGGGGSPSAATATVTGLPVRHAASRSLTARWRGSSQLADTNRLTVDRNRGTLQGALANPFDSALRDCAVLYSNWYYNVGNLGPGEQVRLENFNPKRLEWQLTERRLREQSDVRDTWDRLDHDVPRVMRMLMFHRAAGGEAFTGLYHRYQSRLDLSQHLELGRAILVGQSDQPASKLMTGKESDVGEGRQWTFYRILIPVDRVP